MKKSWKDYLFVSIQFLLFGLYAFDFSSNLILPKIISILGLIVSIIGFFISLLSLLQLNKNITVFPTPKFNSELVTNGLYKFSRHPIYSGIILFSFGFAFYTSSIYRLLIAIILYLLFYFKTIYEEKQLSYTFSNYEKYKKTVGRFFPKLLGSEFPKI